MSRLGKKPIDVPSGVTVTVAGRTVTVKGKNGTLTHEHRPEVSVAFDEASKQVVVSRKNDAKQTRAYHGLTRSLVQNMVTGVSEGFKKELEIVGVGWTANVVGNKHLELKVGYADPKKVAIPMGVKVEVAGNTKITVSGPDKQAVGQFAAQTRAVRKPEPYNGKGIKYADEVIQRKVGKAFGTG